MTVWTRVEHDGQPGLRASASAADGAQLVVDLIRRAEDVFVRLELGGDLRFDRHRAPIVKIAQAARIDLSAVAFAARPQGAGGSGLFLQSADDRVITARLGAAEGQGRLAFALRRACCLAITVPCADGRSRLFLYGLRAWHAMAEILPPAPVDQPDQAPAAVTAFE